MRAARSARRTKRRSDGSTFRMSRTTASSIAAMCRKLFASVTPLAGRKSLPLCMPIKKAQALRNIQLWADVSCLTDTTNLGETCQKTPKRCELYVTHHKDMKINATIKYRQMLLRVNPERLTH